MATKTAHKIFVATMYSGEPDYAHHVKALGEQEGVNIIEHYVISGKSEIDAHNELYEKFNSLGAGCFRLKLDADVVLMHKHSLVDLVEFANQHSHVDWFDPPTSDFLSETIIHAGAAFYTDRIRFQVQKNPLKCDRGVVSVRYKMKDYPVTLGHHMLHADVRTAFHYGFHRSLKGQHFIEDAIKTANEKNPLIVREAALAGFAAARRCYPSWFDGTRVGPQDVPSDHCYGSDRFIVSFNEFIDEQFIVK